MPLKGMTSRNLLKSKLGKGEQTFGVTLNIASAEVSYALGTIGLDWIHLDMQHSILEAPAVAAMIQAMSYSQTVPIIRVPSNDPSMVNKALDIGAHAVVIPLVNSREDAEKAVRSSRYAPRGTRSWGQRAAIRDPEYAATADAEVMIIPQIETELAVRNLAEIVTVEGIDAVFCGPYDLSMSLGVFRQFDNPKFLNILESIISTCQAHNVAPGILAPIGSVKKAVRCGFKMVSLGSDLGTLTGAVAKALADARSPADPDR